MLISVDISLCKHITDIGIMILSQNCDKMERIIFAECDKITDMGVMFLCLYCKGSLRYMDMKYCTNITDTSLLYVSKHGNRLEYLDISGCYRISNNGLNALCTSDCSHHLRTLILYDLRQINDSSVSNICNCHMLQSLCLKFCINVSCTGVIPILEKCLFLRSLDLTGCKAITDLTLGAISNNLSDLEILRLSGCPMITNTGIINLSKSTSFHKIKTLDLSSCINISDIAIYSIIFHCKHVTQLVIYGCPNISGTTYSFLKKKYSHISINNNLYK
jgi:hypothetical protein